jgi:nucleotide-binding universal stress UspA family protein
MLPGSVLVVPAHPGASSPVPPKRLMVGVDGSLRTESVLPEVARLAAFCDAAAVLVHVVTEPRQTGVLVAEEDLALACSLASRLEAGAERYLSRLREQLFQACSRVESVVLRHTDKRRALLDAASQKQADLLVLAAHGSTCDVERPFGSVSSYALAHGQLPLLVLQDLLPSERPRRYKSNGDAPLGVRASFDARLQEET